MLPNIFYRDSDTPRDKVLYLMGGTWHPRAMFDVDSSEISFAKLLAARGISSIAFDMLGTGTKPTGEPFGNRHSDNVSLAAELCREHGIRHVIGYSYGSIVAIDLLKQVSLESFTVLDPTSNARVYWDVKDGDRKVISKLHLLETLRANSVKIPGKLMKDHVNQMINHEGSLVTPAYVDDPTPGVESPHIIDSILAASSHARVHVFFTSSSSEEVISRVPDSMKTCYMDNTHWFLLEDVRHQLAEDVSKFILQI